MSACSLTRLPLEDGRVEKGVGKVDVEGLAHLGQGRRRSSPHEGEHRLEVVDQLQLHLHQYLRGVDSGRGLEVVAVHV